MTGAPQGRSPAWLPAVEQFGEGPFLTLDVGSLRRWLAGPAVRRRLAKAVGGAERWRAERDRAEVRVSDDAFADQLRPECLLAHSLACAFITEVALDCGYPATSIRERVYIVPQPQGPAAVGLLVYTACSGNQGTLGGLVEVSRRFVPLLGAALDRQRLCSGDPVCGDHDPVAASDDRALHGAAGHGCLVIPETSWEARNLFLDRALLVTTVGERGAGFFDG